MIASAGGIPVFTVKFDVVVGTYTFTLLSSLDHADDTLDFLIGFSVTDGETAT